MENRKVEIARWADSDRWIVSTDGDAMTDQPKTEREIELSGRFHGPFESEAAAQKWADDYSADLD